MIQRDREKIRGLKKGMKHVGMLPPTPPLPALFLLMMCNQYYGWSQAYHQASQANSRSNFLKSDNQSPSHY